MATNIHLKLSNSIKGESQDPLHPDEIDILAWSWGMSNSGTTHMATGGGGGKVNVQDISMTKYVDLASNDLIKKCSNGTHIDTADLSVRKAGGDSTVEYFKIKFQMCMISSYSTGGSSNNLDQITENFTMNFRRFEVIYATQDDKGVGGPAAPAGWDIAKNEAWTS